MRKKILMKALSGFMAGALLISGMHISVNANPINLTIADVNENQEVVSYSYDFHGEQKTVYIYQDDNSETSKMTGDIVFVTGTGDYTCSHIDSYIEVPFKAVDISVGCICSMDYYGNLIERWYTLVLDEDGYLYDFNEYRKSTETEQPLYPGTKDEQWSQISYSITKVDGVFYLNNDYLRFATGDSVASNVQDFHIIDYNTNTVLVEHIGGGTSVVSMQNVLTVNNDSQHRDSLAYISQIADNKITLSSCNIESVIYTQNGTDTVVNSLTPTVNGNEYTYTIGNLTLVYDSTYNNLSIESSTNNVFYDYATQSVIAGDEIISFGAFEPSDLGHFVQLNITKDQLTHIIDTDLMKGHYNSVPTIFWTAIFETNNIPMSFTKKDSDTIGFTLTYSGDYSDYISDITIDFTNNEIKITNRNDENVLQTQTFNNIIVNNMIDLADESIYQHYNTQMQSIFEYSLEPTFELSYDPITNSITVVMDEFEYYFAGQCETAYFTSTTKSLLPESAILQKAQNGKFSITGLTETRSYFNNKTMKIDKESFNDIAYAYTVNDDIYAVYDNNTLKQILTYFEENNTIYYTTKEVATDVVKASNIGYLKSNGEYYNYDNTLVRNDVINLVGNRYVTASGTYNADNSEVIYHYATEYNVRFKQNDSSHYTIQYSDDIVSVIAPNGDSLNNGDEYYAPIPGLYLFEITNRQGEVFTEKLYVTGTNNEVLETPIATVINNEIVLTLNPDANSNDKIQYRFEDDNWIDYNGETIKLNLDDNNYDNDYIYYRSVNGKTYSDEMIVYIEDGEVFIDNNTYKAIDANNFCGYAYIDAYGNLMDFNHNQMAENVTAAAVFSNSNSIIYYGYNKSYSYQNDSYSKVRDESDTLNPFLVLYDGYTEYVVGTSGNVVKSYEGDYIHGSCGIVQSAKWHNEWLGTNFESIDANGVMHYAEGSIDVVYNKTLDMSAKDLKYYHREDIEANLDLAAGEKDLTNVPESTDEIIAVRVVENGFTALASNGRVYSYLAYFGAMVDTDTYLYNDTYKTNFTVSDTNWTNENVTVGMTEGFGIGYDNTPVWFDTNELGNTIIPMYCVIPTKIKPVTFTENTILVLTRENTQHCSIQDENGNEISPTQEVQHTTYNNWSTYTYDLPAGTYTFHFINSMNFVENAYTCNGETYYLSDLITVVDTAPYTVYDMEGNIIELTKTIQNSSIVWTMDAAYGLYLVETLDEYDGNTVVAQKYINIANIDTIKPSVTMKSIMKNTLTFDAFDNKGENSAVSGIDKIYYSTNNVDFHEITTDKTIKYSQDVQTISNNCITVNSQYVYMYTVDKAGNKSNVQTFDLLTKEPTISSTPIVDNTITVIPMDGDGKTGDTSKIDNVYISTDNDNFIEIDYSKPIKYDDSVTNIVEEDDVIKVPTKIIYGYTVDVDGKPSEVVPFTVYLELFPTLNYTKDKTSLEFYANDDNKHTNPNFTYEIIENNKSEDIYSKDYIDDTKVTIKVTFVDNGVVSTKKKEIAIKVAKTGVPTINFNDKNNAQVDSSKELQNTKFTTLWIDIDGTGYKSYDKEHVTFDLEPGTHTIKSYQTVVFTDDSSIIINSDVVNKTITVKEPVVVPNPTPNPNTGVHIPVIFWVTLGLTSASLAALFITNKK